ncbi:MAG: hypothetical protein PUD09_04780 [Coriobacteriales bacterium]|nr:hypothetical protein [Coriobacteriales bacterium]
MTDNRKMALGLILGMLLYFGTSLAVDVLLPNADILLRTGILIAVLLVFVGILWAVVRKHQ